MMLAAVETVTKADPVWASRRHDSDVAAQATAGDSIHAVLLSAPGIMAIQRMDNVLIVVDELDAAKAFFA